MRKITAALLFVLLMLLSACASKQDDKIASYDAKIQSLSNELESAVATPMPTSAPTPSPTPASEPKLPNTPTPEPPSPTLSIEEMDEVYQVADYEEYARNPDTYEYSAVQTEGEIIENTEVDGFLVLRVKADGDYSHMWIVVYKTEAGESRLLEGDTIRIFGVYTGIYTYESILGSEVSLPSIYSERIVLKE